MFDQETHRKALDFQIEKTYAAILDIHKASTRGLVTYLVLLGVTVALTFGEGLGVGSNATIPLLQLSMNRHYAGIATLLLSSAMLYWWFSYAQMERIVDAQFHRLLRRRYPAQIDEEFYQYSYRHITLLRMSPIIFRKWEVLDRLFTGGLLVFVLASTLVIPALLAWYLAQFAHFSPGERGGLLIVAVVSVLPTLLVLIPRDDGTSTKRDEQIAGLRGQQVEKVLLFIAFSYCGWLVFLVSPWSTSYVRLVPWTALGVIALLTLAMFRPTTPLWKTEKG